MKKTFFLIFCSFLLTGLSAQALIGAWEANTTSDDGKSLKNVVVFTAGYQVSTWYNAETGEFIKTNGGSWQLDGDMVTETVEFDTHNPDRVGGDVSFNVQITENTWKIIGQDNIWTRIDNGKPGKLHGAWLMSGRIRDGKTEARDTDRPRKTMKVMSGTRFQWIAYNTETKQFMGTGGGTYTTENGEYTENIEFFSKDNSKAGLSLKFNYSMDDGDWHHTGFSSKGDPLHEIWSLRK